MLVGKIAVRVIVKGKRTFLRVTYFVPEEQTLTPVAVNNMNKNIISGFTLIEIILYVGIITIVFGSIVPFAWNVIRGGVKSATQQNVDANSGFISEKIKYEIRNASGITSVTANSISLTNFAPDTSTVIDLSGGRVRINKNGAGNVNISSDDVTVTDLTFTNNSSGDNLTKNIGYTLTVTMSGSRQEYQSTLSLRGGVEVRSN